MFETKQIRSVLDGNRIIFMGSEEVSGWWSVPCRVRPSTSASMFGHPQLKREDSLPLPLAFAAALSPCTASRKDVSRGTFVPVPHGPEWAPTLVYSCPVSASPHTQGWGVFGFCLWGRSGRHSGGKVGNTLVTEGEEGPGVRLAGASAVA
ncbi:hypothetical protein BDP81DRAFT_422044 [Colletotrichum phormii]|uniref:Uncharacterized protein n=1 Tax=Colletotrichum phormii TaxID=359342 RepID=A0AAJ0EIE1_9PEZI|nr:uncharacterized protein BDP81DRAFT_422044 [Colletotrichum phormii]KAK1639909.1 hypothetical protein BDP81DRAFT_422044 [Colletotrichum phormii]